jgi:hypothetical protein
MPTSSSRIAEPVTRRAAAEPFGPTNGGLTGASRTDLLPAVVDRGVRRRGGTYQLADGILDLRFGDRGHQRLVRVAYDGGIYWVYPNQADEVRKPENVSLRQISLKQKGEPLRPANGD